MKQYLILIVACILFFIVGYYTNEIYSENRLNKAVDTTHNDVANCFAIFEKCPYFHPSWDAPFINPKRDYDLQLLKKYENAYELCIKPKDSLRKSYNENFQKCLKNSIYFNMKIYEMDMAIYSGFNHYKAIVEKRKDDIIKFFTSFDPKNKEHIYTIESNSELISYFNIDVPEHISEYVIYEDNGVKPKPKPSFHEGKSAEEIFEMYEAFLTKYDPKNKAHQTELSRWTSDPLFLALKIDENWVEKIEELEDKIFRK